MANQNQVNLLRKSVEEWNACRVDNLYGENVPHIRFDVANASRDDIRAWAGVDPDNWLARTVAMTPLKVDLREADLREADLRGANLRALDLRGADLIGADLSHADLSGADLMLAHMSGIQGTGVNLRAAVLRGANLREANLCEANFREANLREADLRSADLRSADLTKVDLTYATLVDARLENAIIVDCEVFGIAAWNVDLMGATQVNLSISPSNEPKITADNLEVAQFLYLMLHNAKIRDIIDTITSKVVLILGRFTPERKQVLDAIREELRKRNYVPVLFDFEGPASHNFTETVRLLAGMARFIIADLTEPSSIPKELEAIVPHVHVPVQPLIAAGFSPFAMFPDYRLYPWMLKVHRYASLEKLITSMGSSVIEPAEAKVIELRKLRLADDEADS